MNQLYYNPGSCSLAPHIVLEEIGKPYKLKLVSIAARAHHEPEYLAVNPRGRVPALDIGGRVLTETGAILTYLARCHPDHQLMPIEDPIQEARCIEWLAWLSSSVHIAFTQIFRTERYVEDPKDYPAVKAQGHNNLRRHFADIENQLSRTGYAISNKYSIVDPFLLVCFRWGSLLKYSIADDYPAWGRLIMEIATRPAVKRALEQEGVTLGT